MRKISIKKEDILKLAVISLSLVVGIMFFSFLHRVLLAPPINPYVTEESEEIKKEAIQISVLNACGVNGLASKTREYLRSRGFDVVEIGNYPEVLDKSLVCDRLGDKKSAGQVAFALGISDTLIKSSVDSSLFIQASIIIGNDFYQLKPFNE